MATRETDLQAILSASPEPEAGVQDAWVEYEELERLFIELNESFVPEGGSLVSDSTNPSAGE